MDSFTRMTRNVTPPGYQEWNLPSGSLSFGVIDAERVRMKAYLCTDLAVVVQFAVAFWRRKDHLLRNGTSLVFRASWSCSSAQEFEIVLWFVSYPTLIILTSNANKMFSMQCQFFVRLTGQVGVYYGSTAPADVCSAMLLVFLSRERATKWMIFSVAFVFRLRRSSKPKYIRRTISILSRWTLLQFLVAVGV